MSRTSSRPASASAANAPSTRSARSQSRERVGQFSCGRANPPCFAKKTDSMADSIAAYSNEVFGCTGNCLRACFALSARAMASRRHPPDTGVRRPRAARAPPAMRPLHRPAGRDTPARRRRRARHRDRLGGNAVSPAFAMPCAACRAKASAARCPEALAQFVEVARFGQHHPPFAHRRAGRCPAQHPSQPPLPASRAGRKNPTGARSRAGAGSIPAASKSAALVRHRKPVQEPCQRAFDAVASACGNASANAGEIRRRHEVAAQRFRQGQSAPWPVGDENRRQPRQTAPSKRVEQNAAARTTVMPSSTAPDRKR